MSVKKNRVKFLWPQFVRNIYRVSDEPHVVDDLGVPGELFTPSGLKQNDAIFFTNNRDQCVESLVVIGNEFVKTPPRHQQTVTMVRHLLNKKNQLA